MPLSLWTSTDGSPQLGALAPGRSLSRRCGLKLGENEVEGVLAQHMSGERGGTSHRFSSRSLKKTVPTGSTYAGDETRRQLPTFGERARCGLRAGDAVDDGVRAQPIGDRPGEAGDAAEDGVRA